MEPTCYSLFVYGSLRKGFHHPAYQYLSDYFHFVGDARVKGLLYDLGEYPAAVPTKDEKYITGELYSILNVGEFSWIIGQLDDYEGVIVEPGETPLYKRVLATIYHNNKPTQAWIYWYNGPVEGKPLITSGDVLKFMKDKNRR
ncbi:MAG: gamma-glutamylcyclotransferase family protein [Chitinophagaceae bacterium]|nr:gamma-glutamylcyclotransferase family protein [Chitinophagaceae bacterium]